MSEYIDTNLIRFYRPDHSLAGSVDEIKVDSRDTIHIKVTLSNVLTRENSVPLLLVVDKYRRYLHHVSLADDQPEQGPITHNITLPFSKVLNISPSNPIDVCLLTPSSNIATYLHSRKDVYNELEVVMGTRQKEPVPDVPTFRSQLLELILAATNHKYVSRSNQECIPTGNNYQTLELEDTLRLGGRPKRLERLRQIQFSGKKVLDIGANTGEISRYVRRLGARLVDGYEYDPFFVETGRMINAYLGTTRVSLYQGDATEPALYSEKYDIVVALSIYVYIKDVLEHISRITDAMVFETHTLDHGLNFYLDAICKHFPYFRHLGFTDVEPKLLKSRALLLFTTKEHLLNQLDTTDSILIPPGTVNYYYNDSNRNFWTYGVFTDESMEILETKGFEALLAHVEEQYGSIAPAGLQDNALRFFSHLYWPFYLLGYDDYRRDSHRITEQNRFVRYYSLGIEKGQIDQALRYLLDDKELMHKKIALKYEDLDRARTCGPGALPPIVLRRKGDEPDSFKFQTAHARQISATEIDGHHRLFLAKILGFTQFRFYETKKDARDVYSRIIASRYTLSDH